MKSQVVYYITADYAPDQNAGSIRAKAMVECLAESAPVVVLSHSGSTSVGKERVVRLPLPNPQHRRKLLLRLAIEVGLCFAAFARLLFVRRDATIVITSPPFLLCALFLLLPRHATVRRVLDIRDLYPDVFVAAGLVRAQSRLHAALSWIEGVCYRRSDLILTVCNSLKEKIQERAGSTPVEVIMNGYSDETGQLELREDSFSRTLPLTVIAHGNFGQFQDIDLLNEVIDRSSVLPIEFRFVGFGAKLKDIRRRKNVTISGAVPHSEIPRLLQSADVGISFRTSDQTGANAMPVKVFEYMGAGIPAIVVPVMPDLKQIEESGAIRQFHSDQARDIVALLDELCRNSDAYAKMRDSVLRVRGEYRRSTQVARAKEKILVDACHG